MIPSAHVELGVVKVISNILHIEDPDSDYIHQERDKPRDLPDECECPARYNDDLRRDEEPYKCDCPNYVIEVIRPRKTTIWEVLLLSAGSSIVGKGEGQSQEEAHDAAVADAVARRLNAIPAHVADG